MRTAHFFLRFLKSGTPERHPRAEKARFEVPTPNHCEIRARYYDAGARLVINAAACDRRRRKRPGFFALVVNAVEAVWGWV